MRTPTGLVFHVCIVLTVGCEAAGVGADSTDVAFDASMEVDAALPLPEGATRLPERPEQRPGDPERGFAALVEVPYVTCGIPTALYTGLEDLVATLGPRLGLPPADATLPGRTGKNAELPYFLTHGVSPEGVEYVSTNCLTCHAATLGDEVVVGLGNPNLDFTFDAGGAARASSAFSSRLTEAEKAMLEKWAGRVAVVAPEVQTDTVGVNSADNLAAVLFGHREIDTLAWSEDWVMPAPSLGVVPLGTPPWWWMKYKDAMFLTGGGRGDFARIMMTASILCTDTVTEAEAIDAVFADIRAYIMSIDPPAYPLPVDAGAAGRGRTTFEAACASCHGTYHESVRYPNLVVAASEVGTDDLLVRFIGEYASNFIDLWDRSYYGQITDMVATGGYVAPPLVGVWATAPYFHNDSVPTLELVLNSRARPRFWTRKFEASAYDPSLPGYPFETLAAGKDAPGTLDPKAIYDTTRSGYGNGGHTYGDALSTGERADLVEYLKTL